ncbi:hypothetical protein [Frigoribacterium sp. CFBP9030]|uniref:hypothetical protein n=1 Tax=Frigoribacterium sp. CFBP9030 TaxID=3096537 RepID=UPI002A69F0DF|nr:hypothetical protein [Frigoribacterium sp. CFBP9030]MDY0891645.1 hypothetical protein [Frigoribacterium sp. CFBP9030]
MTHTKGSITFDRDAEDIIREASSWWSTPLTFVTDMELAEKMAEFLITAAEAKQDAYCESASKETQSRILLRRR